MNNNFVGTSYPQDPYAQQAIPLGAAPQQNAVGVHQPIAENDKPVNCKEAMAVTSVHDLAEYAKGQLVRLPDFAEGQPFVVRLRRPSLLVLAKSGKIPNQLLSSAGKLFAEGGSGLDSDDESMLSKLYEVIEIIANAALVSPTLAEIESVGMELSDNQLMAIFNYTQSGIQALDSFR